MNVYEHCPEYQNDAFRLCLISMEHCDDLLQVYSDPKAVPFFNGDNCNGDDFHYTTRERMAQAIEFWQWSYREGWFVRWSILDQTTGQAIGTIELFHRDAEDVYDQTGVLRLDLRSDYEKQQAIGQILSLILPDAFDLFYCRAILTKCVPAAAERQQALSQLGFQPSPEPMYGHDGTAYFDYYKLEQ